MCAPVCICVCMCYFVRVWYTWDIIYVCMIWWWRRRRPLRQREKGRFFLLLLVSRWIFDFDPIDCNFPKIKLHNTKKIKLKFSPHKTNTHTHKVHDGKFTRKKKYPEKNREKVKAKKKQTQIWSQNSFVLIKLWKSCGQIDLQWTQNNNVVNKNRQLKLKRFLSVYFFWFWFSVRAGNEMIVCDKLGIIFAQIVQR